MNALNLFEANIVLWIQENLRVGFLTPIVQAITVLGDSGIFWIVLTILLLIFKKTRRLGLCCACALLLDLLAVNIAIKPLVNRVRPYNVITDIVALTGQHGDPSFPSGHSAASFACAWVLFRMERKKMGSVCADIGRADLSIPSVCRRALSHGRPRRGSDRHCGGRGRNVSGQKSVEFNL